MADLTAMTLGKRIAYLRKSRSFTQEALAEQLSLFAQAVSKWEHDLSCPDIMTLPKPAQLLQVTTDTLLTGAVPASAPSSVVRKPPEELVICIQIVSDDDTMIRCNLPFKAFRIASQHSLMSITYNIGTGDESILSRLDCQDILQRIESGATGKILDLTEDGVSITVWTE